MTLPYQKKKTFDRVCVVVAAREEEKKRKLVNYDVPVNGKENACVAAGGMKHRRQGRITLRRD